MNTRTDIRKNNLGKTRKPPEGFEAYGFFIPVVNGGHRIWPPKFKRFIIEGIAKGELDTSNVSKKCKIAHSVIYLWKQEIEKLDKLAVKPETSDEPYIVFGFEVLISNDGRRHWPQELKEYVVSGLANGELTLAQIAKTCDIERTMIYQWRRDLRRKANQEANSIQKPETKFVEVKLTNEEDNLGPNKGALILRSKQIELEIPTNYSPQNIAAIIRELDRSS